jgi:hypothetical protein
MPALMFLHKDGGYLVAGAETRDKLPGVGDHCSWRGHHFNMFAREVIDGELKLASNSNLAAQDVVPGTGHEFQA